MLTVKPVASPTTLSGGEEYYTTKYLKVKPVAYTSMSYVAILSKLTEIISALDLGLGRNGNIGDRMARFLLNRRQR